MQNSKTLPVVFIDTFYDKDSIFEASKFKNYTNQLLDFSNTIEPFECKDIKTALTELMEAQGVINDLKNDLENAQNDLENAKNDLEDVKNNPKNRICLMWSFCFSPPQIGGLGSVMFIMGCIISILIVCCCQKWCSIPCSCCIPGKYLLNYHVRDQHRVSKFVAENLFINNFIQQCTYATKMVLKTMKSTMNPTNNDKENGFIIEFQSILFYKLVHCILDSLFNSLSNINIQQWKH